MDTENASDVLEPVNTANFTDSSTVLPNHLRCACHTLSLIATTCVKKVSDEEFSNRHKVVMEKASDLWHCAARPKSAKIIIQQTGRRMRTPGITRWNSLHDSIKCILQVRGGVNKALGILGKNMFTNEDF